MFRICHWKMLDLILFKYGKMSYITKGMAAQHPLITGRNVNDLSPEQCLPHTDVVRKFIPRGMAVQLPPNNKYKCSGFIG